MLKHRQLIAMSAALAAAAALPARASGLESPAWPTSQRNRPRVQRMVTSASSEIQEWNERVEARNRAKGKRA